MKFDHSKFLGKFILSTVTVANFAIHSDALSPKNLIENLKSINARVVKKSVSEQKNLTLA